LPSCQHDSEVKVGDKAPSSADKFRVLGTLPLSMIEEETAGENDDRGEETPSSPPCSGQQLSHSPEQRLTLTATQTVTQIGGHCGEAGKRWGLSLTCFSRLSSTLI